MRIAQAFLFFIISFSFVSCGTQSKVPNYLQTINDTTGKSPVKFPELTIQKNDLLSIQVYSASTKREISDAPYNLPVASSAGGNVQTNTTLGGFLVDNNGNIEYPRIGLLHVEGLKKQELAEIIKKKINEKDSVLTDPTVIIRFQSLKITILGEVNTQGLLSIPGERVTILEALGLAGGVNDFGMKEKVKVLRENGGQREIGIIDLTSDKAFESPYYHLMQNDVVLVEASSKKAKRSDEAITMQRTIFALSIVTTLALLYTLFK